MSRDDDRTAGVVIALVAGGGLAWWFLRNRGPGGVGDGTARPGHGRRDPAPPAPPHPPAVPPPLPASPPAARREVHVMLRGTGIELDGAPADLATVVAAATVAGAAVVRATGDVREGAIVDLVRALIAGGVRVSEGGGLMETFRRLTADEIAAEGARGASAPI